ncbi:MAG: protein kinase, partial [Myxococcales bacterium]|nr:protein kinase [Myxococcales bacterium]
VHRDVSPQNLLVGMDGVSRVVDFGVAKAVGRLQATAEGNLKGKLGYFSPEQLKQDVDRRTDVFAAAIVLWEALSAKRLFVGDTPWDIAQEVAHKEVVPPSELDGEIPKTLSDAVMRGLERDKNARYQTARDFAQAIESALSLATTTEVSVWVQSVAGKELDHKRALLSASEDMADLLPPPSTARPRAQVEREDVPTTGGGAIVADRLAASSRPSASSAPRDGATSPEEIEEPAPSATTPSVELPRARVSAPTAPVGRPNWIIGGAGVLVGVAGIAFALGRTQLSETKGMEQSAVASAAPPADAQSVLSSPPPVMPPIVPSEHPSSSTSAVSSGGPSARPRPSVASDVARSAPIVEVSETPVHGKRCYHIGTPFTGTWCADKSHASGFGCVNLLDNRKHCGSCGKPCNVGEWCQSGKCSVPSCPPGLTLCPGGCVDLSFNASNCGSCGEVCKVRCVNRRCDDK